MVGFNNLEILIVDGKRINARLLNEILNGLGVARITTVSDSKDALRCLSQRVFNAVFCDDAVGPLDPAAFVTALRKDTTIESRQVPVILMSAAPEKRQVEMARDSGFNDFIAVPVSANTVKSKLTSVLLAPKPFISSEAFAGPDRRRRRQAANGPAPGAKGANASTDKWNRRSSDSTPEVQPSQPEPEAE